MLALMLTTMTACEKASMDDVEDGGSGQVTNALLQVRTRGGGGSEATVSIPSSTAAYVRPVATITVSKD